jgi:hypothetical protein
MYAYMSLYHRTFEMGREVRPLRVNWGPYFFNPAATTIPK